MRIKHDRPRSFRAPLTDQELAQMHAVSGHEGVDAATLFRQFIAREHERIFGKKKPRKGSR
jgi:hypothetical protein